MSVINETMRQKALSAFERAYAPYSSFAVGACVASEGGDYFAGCNVENASYGLTQCAEASAIAAMVAAGRREIQQIMIVAESETLCPPCGACRQRIAEFAAADTEVILSNQRGEYQVLPFADLFPLPFGLKFLGEK